VEDAVRAEGEALERAESAETTEKSERVGEPVVGDRVRLPSGGTGKVLEIRSDQKLVIGVGAMRMVVDMAGLEVLAGSSQSSSQPSPSSPSSPSSQSSLEIDLRGMTGDEAEMATLAAVDAAVLSEQPFLRIIHGMGTGVVRERVQRVVSKDRRVSKYAFAPRNQGGTGVTIVEFSA
jgi:DNA mismatch repair protein MutS2